MTGFGAYSSTRLCICLNSSVAGPADELEERRLDARDHGAGALRLRRARAPGSRRSASPTASSATWTSTPSSSRSRTVWLTHTWASTPQTRAWSRPSRSKPSASAAEKQTFSIGSTPSGSCLGDLRHGLAQPLRVLLGDHDRDADAPRRRGPGSPSPRRCRRSSGTRLAEGLLDVDHDQRRPARGRASRRSRNPHREAALPVGDPAGDDRHQDSSRAGGARRSRSCPSGSPSPRRPPPTRPRGRRGPGWPRYPARGSAARSPNGAAPALIRSTRMPRSSTPGSDELGVERRECRLEAGDAHRGLLERDLLLLEECGAWSVAMQSMTPGANRLDQRLAVVLGAQRRVHLEARVEAADRLVGERQVVRGRLAGDPDSGGLRRRHRLHRLAGRQVLDVDARVLVGGQRGVARDHRRLRDRRDAGEAERGRDDALVHHAADVRAWAPAGRERSWSSSCSAMLAPDQVLVLKRAAHHARAGGSAARRRRSPTAPGVAKLGHLGQLPALHAAWSRRPGSRRARMPARRACSRRAQDVGRRVDGRSVFAIARTPQ